MADEPLSLPAAGRPLRRDCRPYPGRAARAAVRHVRRRPRTIAQNGWPQRSCTASAGARIAAFAAGGIVLAVLAWFLGDTRPHQPASAGPCSEQLSTRLGNAGLALRMRFEPTAEYSGLIHLCLDAPSEIVRSWALTLRTPAGDLAVPVLAVGDRQALADATIVTTVRLDIELGLTGGGFAGFDTVLKATAPRD